MVRWGVQPVQLMQATNTPTPEHTHKHTYTPTHTPMHSPLLELQGRQHETDVDFCHRMTTEAGVTLIPVSAFYVNKVCLLYGVCGGGE